MDELCKISDSITANVTTAAGDSNFSNNKFNQQSYELEPMMMEFDMYQGSRRAEEDTTTGPDFDFESIWVDQNRTSEEILLSSQPIPEAKNLMGMQVTESLESESFFKCQMFLGSWPLKLAI